MSAFIGQPFALSIWVTAITRVHHMGEGGGFTLDTMLPVLLASAVT